MDTAHVPSDRSVTGILEGARTRVFEQPIPVPIRNRIPIFPRFKRLDIGDQFEIERWVRQFQPYSDFNFVSLYSWNTTDEIEVSLLNDNLVVLFSDYSTAERFFSFMGTNLADETADILLNEAKRRGTCESLKLLPRETAMAISPRPGYVVKESQDNCDYI